MGQQQSRFSLGSLSLATKLLASVLLLIIVIVGFLNLSGIYLFQEDKRAYIYQSQATEAALVGREFVNNTTHALDTLRISLAQNEQAQLISILNNQSDLISISHHLVTPETKSQTRQRAATKSGWTSTETEVPDDWWKAVLPELLEQGYAFVNLSRVGKEPVIAVFFADLSDPKRPGGIPVAVGALPLGAFSKNLSRLSLSVATKSGWLLFDTDPATRIANSTASEDSLFQIASKSKLDGAQEFDSNGERFIGTFAKPGLNLIVLVRTPWLKAMKASYTLTEKFILLGLIAGALSIVLALIFSKKLVQPLNRLYQATRDVAQGNFSLELTPQSGDEIGALTSSFNVMSKKIGELIREQMEKVRLENELAIASTVQQTLIPPEIHDESRFRIVSHYQAATECGGDWWGFFRVGDKLCVMIADATGHGLPSALITAAARSCFSVMQKLAQEDEDFTFSPAAMLAYANRVIYDAAHGKIMMTFFIGVIDFDQKKITYSNAGHNPPWLFKKDGAGFALRSMVALGRRLGEANDVEPFEEKSLPLGEGDLIFLYTDGLMEGKDQSGAMYGKKRTKSLVESKLVEGPDQIVSGLVQDFVAHNHGKPLDDDVTIAVAQIRALGSENSNPNHANA